MHYILAIYTLLAVAAEASPLRVVDRRESAILEWMKRDGAGGKADPTTMIVSFVPGKVLKETKSPNSILTETSTESPTQTRATARVSTTKNDAGQRSSSISTTDSATSKTSTSASAVSEIPTVITDLPNPTATIPPDAYRANLELAKQYNTLYSTLTSQSPCIKNQAACIGDSTAICSTGNRFVLAACPAGTSCFALPLDNIDGVELACVSRAAAEKVLGSLPPAASSSPASTTATTATSPAAGSQFTRTATITQTTGPITITLTFDPARGQPIATDSPSITTRSSNRFPTESASSATTTTTTAATDSPPPVVVVPVLPSSSNTTRRPRTTSTSTSDAAAPTGASTVTSLARTLTRTLTRTRRPPAETSNNGSSTSTTTTTQVPQGAPANTSPQASRQTGPNEDTRVTFTLVDKVTVTQGSVTVTVTAGAGVGAAAPAATTVTERETVTLAASTVLVVG